MPLYPSKVLQAKEHASIPYSFAVFSLGFTFESFRSWECVRLVQKELVYDQHSLPTNGDNAEDRFNDDKRNAYEIILNVMTNKEGELFFMYGGTGKIFVWTTFLSHLQGQGKIVLVVASLLRTAIHTKNWEITLKALEL
jgi:hypothetical protein